MNIYTHTAEELRVQDAQQQSEQQRTSNPKALTQLGTRETLNPTLTYLWLVGNGGMGYNYTYYYYYHSSIPY